MQVLTYKIDGMAVRRQSWRGSWLAVVVLITLLTTACASRRSSAASSVQPSNSSQRNTTTANALPGGEEFGLSMEAMVKAIETGETLIAECMNEAGFEYIAVDYKTFRRGMVSDKSLPGYSEEQYIAEFGFGISTLYTGLPPQLAREGTPARIGLGEQNAQLFKNLSATDQVAYNRTLFGENTDATFAVGLETEDFSRTGGCTRKAIEQVFTPEQLSTTYLNPKDALIEQDPRMVDALGKFADCMHTAGFDYNYEREVEPDLKKRLFAITNGAPVETLSADARAALAKLQEEEVAIAYAVTRCESQTLDAVESQVERELFARQG